MAWLVMSRIALCIQRTTKEAFLYLKETQLIEHFCIACTGIDFTQFSLSVYIYRFPVRVCAPPTPPRSVSANITKNSHRYLLIFDTDVIFHGRCDLYMMTWVGKWPAFTVSWWESFRTPLQPHPKPSHSIKNIENVTPWSLNGEKKKHHQPPF